MKVISVEIAIALLEFSKLEMEHMLDLAKINKCEHDIRVATLSVNSLARRIKMLEEMAFNAIPEIKEIA